MQPPSPFVSHAPNREDVVLWRALGSVPRGRYVSVGDPSRLGPITTAFDDGGWHRDVVAPAPADAPQAEHPVHLLVVTDDDVEELLTAGGLGALQPWVVVVVGPADDAEPADPAWEPAVLAAGYAPRLFDGVNRFYVAQERADALGSALSYPACTRDRFVDAGAQALLADRAALVEDVRRWRTEALSRRADVDPGDERRMADGEFRLLRREIDAMRASVSWRVTAPLRSVRRRMGRP